MDVLLCFFALAVKSRRFLADIAITGADVGESSWPSTTFVADAAVFKIERSETCRSQSVTQMSGMSEVVFRPPEAAVQIDQNRVRPVARRETYVDKLVAIAAVGLSLVGWRWWLGEDVFRGHRLP